MHPLALFSGLYVFHHLCYTITKPNHAPGPICIQSEECDRYNFSDEFTNEEPFRSQSPRERRKPDEGPLSLDKTSVLLVRNRDRSQYAIKHEREVMYARNKRENMNEKPKDTPSGLSVKMNDIVRNAGSR